MVIKAGTVLSFVGGEEFDRWRSEAHHVLIDFDQQAVEDQYRAHCEKAGECPNHDDFIRWLVEHNYVKLHSDRKVWHIGRWNFNPDNAE